MSRLEFIALAEALEHWPQQSEVFGCASDGTREVLVHGEMINGVLVFSQPVLIDTLSPSRT
jgi:hypothetical protein